MRKLPNWHLTNYKPAFYDFESLTVVEQTAKLYGAMQELINEYNETMKCFTTGILNLTDDFITLSDSKIDDAIKFMKTNLTQSIVDLLETMKNDGTLDEAILNSFNNLDSRVNTLEDTEYKLVFEEDTENLILQKTVKEGE